MLIKKNIEDFNAQKTISIEHLRKILHSIAG